MSFINRVVSVTINKASASVVSQELNTMLFIGNTKAAAGATFRCKEYSSLAAVAVDYSSVANPEYKAAAAYFGQDVKPKKILIGQILTADGGDAVVAYNAIKAVRNDFLVVTCYDKTLAKVQALADAVQADEKKAYGVCDNIAAAFSADEGTDTTSLSQMMKTQAYSQCFAFANKAAAATDYPECALIGYLLAKPIGSASASGKELVGVTADDLADDEATRVLAKKATLYNKIGNSAMTFGGTMGNGEYIDVMLGLIWIESNVQINIINILKANDKVPMTTQGIEAVKGALKSSLLEGAKAKIIDADSIVIDAPRYEDLTAADKAARNIPNVVASFTLQGAIHSVGVTLTVKM